MPILKNRLIIVLLIYLWPIAALLIVWKHRGYRFTQWCHALRRPDLYAVFPHFRFNEQAVLERRSDILAAIFNAYHFYICQPKTYETENKGVFRERMVQFNIPHLSHLDWEDACNLNKEFIIKDPDLDMGQGVGRITSSELRELKNDPPRIIQPIYKNHPELLAFLPPNAPLCTVRILTGRTGNTFSIFTSYFRIGDSDQIIDNLSKGGLLVELDITSGEMLWGVNYEMMQGRVRPKKLPKHPKASQEFRGQTIPYYQEACQVCLSAHEKIASDIQSVGWDVAISREGPLLIEANIFAGSYEIFRFSNLYRRSLDAMQNILVP